MDRSFTERGMALIAVIAVLIALVLIATPFALQMKSAARRAESVLYTEQADQEAQSLFAFANLYLLNSTDPVERENAANEEEAFCTPDYDTRDEFMVPRQFLEEFNRNSARGRIWDVRIEDEQSKVNVNSAPYTLLANLLGATSLSKDIDEGEDRIRVADATVFPEKDGLVRIGNELIRYRERKGGYLEGCERGVNAGNDWNGEPQTWEKGELVMRAEAFEVATLPLRIRKGFLTPYGNLYEIRRISELGQVGMDPDTFDRNAGYLTCYSGREVAGGWCNTQTLRSKLPSSSEGSGDYFVVDNARYFGRGTVVRITDGVNTDYGLVINNNSRTVVLANRVEHEYDESRARVESLARHPVNLNTASDEVVLACLTNVGLRLRDADSVTSEEAAALLPYLRENPVKSLYQLKEIYRRAQSDGVISQMDYYALYMNALNPSDYRLKFSTVPFCFKSYDIYTVNATAVVNSRQGEEIARKTVSRVVSVNPRRSAVWKLESQDDFEGQIIASRLAKWFMTGPYNTGGHWENTNIPASRFTPHIIRDIWPSYSDEPGVGEVRLLPERMTLAGVQHFDESYYAEGYYVRDGPLSYSTKHKDVNLADDDGMRPLAVSFWYKPLWGGLGSTQHLMDTGKETWQNRVGLFYDSTTSELVLRVCDATYEQKAVEVRYKVDGGELQDETWYHMTAEMSGTKPGDLTMLVDGLPAGEATYMTRLTQSIGATDDVTEIMVDNAESFPAEGALLVRGEEGAEILEYDSRTDSSFSIRRRFARIPKDVIDYDENFQGRSHPEGAVVELLGYSHPLLSDLPQGGSTLVADLGRFHAMKVIFGEDILPLGTGDSGNGGGGGGGPAGGIPGGSRGAPPPSFMFQDPINPPAPAPEGGDGGGSQGSTLFGIASDRTQVLLKVGEVGDSSAGLAPWDQDVSPEEALLAFGDTGYAIMASIGRFDGLAEESIGGPEIVYYEKQGDALLITRYQMTKGLADDPDVVDTVPHFVPQHTYGDPDATVHAVVNGVTYQGLWSALIPISVEVTQSGDMDYFNVYDEAYLDHAYAQIEADQSDTEWFQYTYPDNDASSGRTLLVWDKKQEVKNLLNLFAASTDGSGTIEYVGGTDSDDTTPTDEPPTDGGDDGGDTATPPDDEPPAPEPPAPPDPGDEPPSGGDDDGGPTGGDTPPPDLPPAPGGEDDGTGAGDGGTTPPPDLPPPPGGEDDGGPTGGSTPPPDLPPTPGGEDDTGASGGETPPPEPPLPPGGEDDGTGAGDDGGGGGEEPPPDPGDEGDPPPADEPADDGADGPAGGDLGGRVPSDAPSGNASDDVPWTEVEIAERLKHRPVGTAQDRKDELSVCRIGDTYAPPVAHSAGDEVRPAFQLAIPTSDTLKPAIEQTYAGRDDRVTLATADGPQEEFIINHGFVENHYVNWVALTSFPSASYDYAEDDRAGIVAGTIDTRRVPRLLKFPSGELPTEVADNVWFGSRFDGTGLSPSFLDELYFRKAVNEETYYLGDGDLLEEQDDSESTTWAGIDAQETEIKIHMWPTSGNRDGLPITDLPEDGGVIRIDDEVIVYEELETSTGTLKGCIRQALTPDGQGDVHEYGAHVTEVDGVTIALLDGGLDTTSYEIPMNRNTDFPRDGGYVRIDDEILGYTRLQGNTLVMPQELEADGDKADETKADTGGGIFRARFGTEASDHDDKAVVFYWPARFPDRYADRSVDPETSCFIVSKRVDGAIWKRISWDEKLIDYSDIRVLARFDGGPDWDSDNIYSLDDGMVVSGSTDDFRANPKSFLFLVTDPHAVNRFGPEKGIQADRIELKISFQFQAGAFDDLVKPPVNSWKDTPWLKALRLEFVAPVTVHYTEHIR